MNRRASAVVAGLCLSALAGAAAAQNALGDGSLQGANETVQANDLLLRRPGAVLYPQLRPQIARRPNYNQDLAFRNAIVTGNIGGGLDFRGELGYTGTFDFRGELGSDDIFDFQRRAIPASNATLLGTAPVRANVSPADQSLGYTVSGQQSMLGGAPIIRRPGSGLASAEVLGSGDGRVPEVDIYGRVQGGLRAPSAFQQRAASTPAIIGSGQNADGDTLALVADPLLGVKPFNLEGYRRATISRDLRARDLALPRSLLEEMAARRTTPEGAASPGVETDGAASAEPAGDVATAPVGAQRLSPQATTAAAYRRVIDELRLRNPELPEPAPPLLPAPAPLPQNPLDPPEGEGEGGDAGEGGGAIDPYSAINAHLDRLRAELAGVDMPASVWGASPLEGSPVAESAPGAPEKPDRYDAAAEARRLLGLEPIAVERLTNPDSLTTLFDEHVAVGEAYLREGRFFDAEERFTAALMLAPGDPIASAGRVLAQVSAGLYLSADLNMRAMFTAYPELALVEFDEALLPGAERRERILEQLRERAAGPTPSARAAGLLLAYLGRQLGSHQDVVTGLDAVERVNDRLDAGDDPLVRMLRGLWLGEGSPPDE